MQKLIDIVDYDRSMTKLRLVFDLNESQFRYLSFMLGSIARESGIKESTFVDIVTSGVRQGFDQNDLADFVKLSLNAMFILRSNPLAISEDISNLVMAFNKEITFEDDFRKHQTYADVCDLYPKNNDVFVGDQCDFKDIINGANSVLMSIVYLVNVVNNKVMFVK